MPRYCCDFARARARLCDDLALDLTGARPVAYAQTLASLERCRARPRGALAATGGSLAARVRRLLGRPAPRQRSGTPWLGLASLTLVIASASLPLWGLAAQPTTEEGPYRALPATDTPGVEFDEGFTRITAVPEGEHVLLEERIDEYFIRDVEVPEGLEFLMAYVLPPEDWHFFVETPPDRGATAEEGEAEASRRTPDITLLESQEPVWFDQPLREGVDAAPESTPAGRGEADREEASDAGSMGPPTVWVNVRGFPRLGEGSTPLERLEGNYGLRIQQHHADELRSLHLSRPSIGPRTEYQVNGEEAEFTPDVRAWVDDLLEHTLVRHEPEFPHDGKAGDHEFSGRLPDGTYYATVLERSPGQEAMQRFYLEHDAPQELVALAGAGEPIAHHVNLVLAALWVADREVPPWWFDRDGAIRTYVEAALESDPGPDARVLLERLAREVDDPGAQEALLDRIRTHAFVADQEVIA